MSCVMQRYVDDLLTHVLLHILPILIQQGVLRNYGLYFIHFRFSEILFGRVD